MMNPLKVGLVTGEYPPMEGGVGAYTQEMARALAAAGHQLHVITDKEARPPLDRRSWRQLKEPVDGGGFLVYPHIRKWRWKSVSEVTDLIIRHELDIVNIQYQAAAYDMRSPAVNLLPWRLKGVVPTVVTFHDLRVPYLFPKAGRLREGAVTFMARQAAGVIATNAADHQALAARCDTPAAQIPIGSNIPSRAADPQETAAVRRRLGLKPGDRLLGYFGFLNESKGADTLLEALRQAGEGTHLLFIGGQTGSSDPDNNQSFQAILRRQIDTMGLTRRVHWTGFVEEAEVSAYLHAADLMVMPYRDGVSLRRGTLMAALAHGRPLLTTEPRAAAPELRHRHNVYLVPPNDAGALAAAVQELFQDEPLRLQLGSGAKVVADLFTWDVIAARTAEFFHQRCAAAAA